jgi:DNA-binding response OmpR family regulator
MIPQYSRKWAQPALKLLIVDDDERFRRLLVMCLETEYFAVACAPNGLEAIEFLQNNSIDVVLTDFRMQYVSGWQLAKWIRQNRPGVAVCLMSAGVSEEFPINSACILDAMLPKPFSLTALLLTLDIAISRRKAAMGDQGCLSA